MNAAFAFCAMVMVGAGSSDFLEPIAPSPENPPLQQPNSLLSNPQTPLLSKPQTEATGERPTRAVLEGMSEPSPIATFQPPARRPAQAYTPGVMRTSRMPLAPTDPNALSREDFPLPPTMNHNSTSPGVGMTGTGQRLNSPGLAESGGYRAASQKPFGHYSSAPASSPYTLLSASTDNGTVNPYVAYVRPAQEQQQANQDIERAANGPNQTGPVYPAVFLNTSQYYPNYGVGR